MLKLIKDLGMIKPKETSNYKKRYGIYECQICNKHFKTMTDNVKKGSVKSCKSCSSRIKATKHNYSKDRLYSIWANIKQRCLNNNNPGYDNYGKRKITMCNEWFNFVNFKDWALNNGYKDNLTIDRINVNGNYEPSNCRFVDWYTQMNNKRESIINRFSINELKKIQNEYNNGLLSQKEIITKYNISSYTLYKIMNGGYNGLKNCKKDKLRATNVSGYKGVSKVIRNNKEKWYARITINGKRKHIGYFDTPKDANNAIINYKKNNNL